jgi:hypothetical protein
MIQEPNEQNELVPFPDVNEETELQIQRELECEPFANDLYEREEGL